MGPEVVHFHKALCTVSNDLQIGAVSCIVCCLLCALCASLAAPRFHTEHNVEATPLNTVASVGSSAFCFIELLRPYLFLCWGFWGGTILSSWGTVPLPQMPLKPGHVAQLS